MAEPRLGPEELDRLEDALEDLEFTEAISDPSAAVSQRLADFRTILQASREAMPLEEVPEGLLEGVISEARMSEADIPAPDKLPAKEGLWARVRRVWLIPGLAVAGSAALVLLLVQPTLQSREPAEGEVGSVAMKDGSAAPAPASPAPAEAQIAGEGAKADQAPPPAKAQRDSNAAAASPPAAPPPEEPRLEPDAEAEPEPAPAPAPAEVEKKAAGEGWDAIERGDEARKGGDCFTARNHYARALDDGNDSVRARAYVGLGMCKQEEGNDAAARDYFDKARELDEDAVDFAATQSKSRAKERPRPRRKQRKPSSKRKSSIDFDEAKDPFSG